MEIKKYKIFVLDDKEENLEAARKALSQYGEVKTAQNYEEGEQAVSGYNPDIAFIDLHFSQVEGGIEERLGYKFRDEILRKQFVPNCIVTGGIKHGTGDVVRLESRIYLPMDEPDQFYDIKDEDWTKRFNKTNPGVWEYAYDMLMGGYDKKSEKSRELTKRVIDMIIANKH